MGSAGQPADALSRWLSGDGLAALDGITGGSLDVIGLFNEAGAHCVGVDYPGFGMSGGKPSEAGCYAAAEAAYGRTLGWLWQM